MIGQDQSSLGRGQAALVRGDTATARAHFLAVLESEPAPEAWEGLGLTAWWDNDLDAAIQHLERAHAEYVQGGKPQQAAVLAMFLSNEYAALYANQAASSGWLARAERWLEGSPCCAALARLELKRADGATCPEESERRAQNAWRIARECGNPDMEFLALSAIGKAEVNRGRVKEGTKHIDEAMAAATGGEVRDRMVVGLIYCAMIATCERIGDFKRATEWCHIVEDFARRNSYAPLFGFCQVIYANVLTATGRWWEAEQALLTALDTYKSGHRGLVPFARSALSELRIRQGRLEEAELLLQDCEEHPAACQQVIRLCLARGDLGLPDAILARRLGTSSPCLANAALYDLRVDVKIAQGDLAGAARTAAELREFSRDVKSVRLSAMAELAMARVRVAGGEDEALEQLEKVLVLLSTDELPLERARAELAIAVLLATQNPARALAEAKSALRGFEALGAARDADAASELLRRLGVKGRTGPKQQGKLTKREDEVLLLVAAGLSNSEIAGRLFISPKTAEHHVSNILSKLGLRSRAEVAAWATVHKTRHVGGPK